MSRVVRGGQCDNRAVFSNHLLLSVLTIPVRDWSLSVGRGGGLQNGMGVACEILPLRKGGGVAILKGVYKRFWGNFYAVA